MKGKHNSVLSRIKKKQPNVYDMGCVCHLAHLAVGDAIKAIPIDVEQLLIETFYFFEASSKRREEFQEFQIFVGVDLQEILKHVSTRWLSLAKCIKRMLSQWPALKAYFNSNAEKDRPGRVKRICGLLNSPMYHACYMFLSYVMPMLDEFNVAFQSDECKIGFIHAEMK